MSTNPRNNGLKTEIVECLTIVSISKLSDSSFSTRLQINEAHEYGLVELCEFTPKACSRWRFDSFLICLSLTQPPPPSPSSLQVLELTFSHRKNVEGFQWSGKQYHELPAPDDTFRKSSSLVSFTQWFHLFICRRTSSCSFDSSKGPCMTCCTKSLLRLSSSSRSEKACDRLF